jgi:hypothetical protein
MRQTWTWARITVLLAGAAVASAEPTAAQRTLAAKLLEVMQVQQTMEQQFDGMRGAQLEAMQRMMAGQATSPEAKQRMEKMHAAITDLIKKELSWTAIKAEFVDMYASTFTADELHGLIDFYESPIGRAFVAKTPELTRRAMELTTGRMQALLPRVQQLIMETMQQAAPPADDDRT